MKTRSIDETSLIQSDETTSLIESDETSLIHSDCIIEISEDENENDENENIETYSENERISTYSTENKIQLVSQDVINIIASYLSYNAALANLRETSKRMYQLIEKTPAGQLAREGLDLLPSRFGTWIAINTNFVEKSIVQLSATFGFFAGLSACIYSGIAMSNHGASKPFINFFSLAEGKHHF